MWLVIAVGIGVALLVIGFLEAPDYKVTGVDSVFGLIGCGALAFVVNAVVEGFFEELLRCILGFRSDR